MTSSHKPNYQEITKAGLLSFLIYTKNEILIKFTNNIDAFINNGKIKDRIEREFEAYRQISVERSNENIYENVRHIREILKKSYNSHAKGFQLALKKIYKYNKVDQLDNARSDLDVILDRLITEKLIDIKKEKGVRGIYDILELRRLSKKIDAREVQLDQVIKGMNKNDYISYLKALQLSREIKPVRLKIVSEDIQKNGVFVMKNNYRDIVGQMKQGIIELSYKNERKSSAIGAFIIKNDQGKDELHITFRGTDKNFRKLFSYFVNDYLYIEKTYNQIRPVVNNIIKNYIRSVPNDKDINIVFSGHSLGAALASRALSEYKDSEQVKYHGIGFGSPGGMHRYTGWVNLNTKIYDASFKDVHLNKVDDFLNRLDKRPSIKLAKSITKTMWRITTGAINTVALGLLAIQQFFPKSWQPKKEQDARFLSIENDNDLIPKVGKAIYRNYVNTLEIKSKKSFKNFITLADHSASNYVTAIDKMSQELKEKHNEWNNEMFIDEQSSLTVENSKEEPRAENEEQFNPIIDKLLLRDKIEQLERVTVEETVNRYHIG